MNADSRPPERWGRHRKTPDVPPEAVRASWPPFLFWLVAGGIALTLSCIVLIHVWALSLDAESDRWSALVWTVLVAGAPVVFLGVRLVIYLRAHDRGSDVRFWPHDRSAAVNWGLTLLWLNLGLAVFIAFHSVDELVFGGQIGDWLAAFDY